MDTCVADFAKCPLCFHCEQTYLVALDDCCYPPALADCVGSMAIPEQPSPRGSGAHLAIAQHALLDAQISEDITIGVAGMLPDTTHYLSIPLATLKQYTLVQKRLSLDSVRLGRKHFAQAQVPTPAFAQERAFMLAWRNSLPSLAAP